MVEELEFHPPLLVLDSDKPIELRDVHGAIEFLQTWPHSRRDKKWLSALRCCEYARDGLMRAPAARRSVESWAEKSGVKVAGVR